ncbi:hypothetical protein [Streptomyces anulatus]|uniref:hypothetical protein n=1 Tax=Streptomyces anulatus TaxID=1892 RepID=UPI0034432F9B
MADRPPPLVVIPLPARLTVVSALLDALGGAWEADHGTPLTTARMSHETTPWGPALVVREGEEP